MKKTSTKIVRISFFAICLIVVNGCGTLGGWDDICFSVPKKTFEVQMDSLFIQHPEYKIPQKWNDLNDWSERGYDFLESWIFYFPSSPEEMYYVTIVTDPANSTELKTTIAIRSVNMGDRWFNHDEVNEKERERIEARFEKEIVSKLEAQLHTRATKEDRY
jgi:hypothetical protein